MLYLRPYKPCDAERIAAWCDTELTIRRWSADKYAAFPPTAEEINENYLKNNGGCNEADNFYPFTAFNGEGAVGHLVMRFTDSERKTVRFGFVILNPEMRGQGLGKELIHTAVRYAREFLGAEVLTIGVFENNPAAYACYKAVGFSEPEENRDCFFEISGESWHCIELEMKL